MSDIVNSAVNGGIFIVAALVALGALVKFYVSDNRALSANNERLWKEARDANTMAVDRLNATIGNLRTEFRDADGERERAQSALYHDLANRIQGALAEQRKETKDNLAAQEARFAEALRRLEDRIGEDFRSSPRRRPP